MNAKKYFKVLGTILLIGFAAIAGYIVAVWVISGEPPAIISPKLDNKTILVMGTDEGGFRSDVMMVVFVNAKQNTIDVISVLRDSKVEYKGKTRKINTVLGLYGPKDSMAVVSKMLGTPINNYVLLSFSGFRNIIDTLGGVDFNVPQNMKYDDPEQNLHIDLKEGQQHLNGTKSEQLVRFREYLLGDEDRIKVQQAFLQELFKQKITPTIILKAPKLMIDIGKAVKTDLTLNKMTNYATMASKFKEASLATHSLPGEAKMIGDASYFIVDEPVAKALVDEIEARVAPSKDDLSLPVPTPRQR